MAFPRKTGIWLASALFAAIPGARATAASVNVTASVKTVKPLVLTAKQNLDFGLIILTRVTAPTSVSISQAGVKTCGVGLTCSGASLPAIFSLTGTNNTPVRIVTAPSSLTNATGNSVAFTPNAPTTLTLANSGSKGDDFNVGGSIALTPTTADGLYSGNVEITVDYQ
ncbi:MAG: DUF4402 domain-containing protein [Sphingomonas sp.]|uniref:DUF4402 domain-containing protein n=1 Tax=Sphingomonas sp. TaxID=28214 RepID=UPI0017C71C5E|nr:DUF4402 domain-containing protein [Sphingomonas sp.]MBA3667174.1 DUF4402 domain-containing protein [Sphingomonas sp.]